MYTPSSPILFFRKPCRHRLAISILMSMAAALLIFAIDSPGAADLPPLPSPEAQGIFAPKIVIENFNFTGNSVFSDSRLKAIAAPYTGRPITFEDLEALRHKLTRHYTDRGYINSGAVLPDQKVEKGTITYRIIEGKLTAIDIIESRRLRDRYIKSRLATGAGPPLNINELQQQVQLLHLNRLIHRINAVLEPGMAPGESRLEVKVDEERAWLAGIEVNNHRSPSIGGERIGFYGAHRNLTGWGDALYLSYGITEGLDDFFGSYRFPLTAKETAIKVSYNQNAAEVVEAPFHEINIESESRTWGITLSRPLFKTPEHELVLSLSGEKRHSETSLLNEPYSFSLGVPPDGKSDISVLRLSGDWLLRKSLQVFAARSVFSFGVDAMDATINSDGLPDSRFFTWLGQFQWARRFPEALDSRVIFKIDLQLANDPLLPLEKFSVGGANSVRGYRENLLVRDSGIISSLEWRTPLFRAPIPKISTAPEDGFLQAALFYDWGWAKNREYHVPGPDTISSAGLGLLWDPSRKIHAEIYWGYGFREIEHEEEDLQDEGVHFRVDWQVF